MNKNTLTLNEINFQLFLEGLRPRELKLEPEKMAQKNEAEPNPNDGPHPRDILKLQHEEAQKRPRNYALEKWGPLIENEIVPSRKSKAAPPTKSPTSPKASHRKALDLDR